MPRFKTMLRGMPVDVEMEILSLDPISFTTKFHGEQPAGGELTRPELAYLARQAGEAAKAQIQQAVAAHAALQIEVQQPDGAWTTVSCITARTPRGSMSDNRPNGERHLIVFQCHGESSVIARSAPAQELAVTDTVRLIDADSAGETLARLRSGESFTLTVHGDVSPAPRTIRFTHC